MPALEIGLPALDGAEDLAFVPSPAAPEDEHRGGMTGERAAVVAPVATPTSATSTAPVARPRLEDIWPEPPSSRKLPPKLRAALIGAGVLLVVVVALGHRGRSTPATASAAINDDMVVSSDDLKNRREVRAEDFRPKQRFAMATPPAPVPEPDLQDRHARRQADPEDILTLKRGAKRNAPAATAELPLFDGPIYVLATSSGRPGEPAAGQGEHLAAAGTTLRATLITPLKLRAGSSTVIAQVDRRATTLSGARFLGAASLAGNRITVRFTKLLLADGREARVDAEAQDADGGFGLAVSNAEGSEERGGSVLGDVAKDTATDMVTSVVGSGLAGQVIGNYRRRAGGQRGSSNRGPVSVSAGMPLQIFLREGIDLGQ